MSRGGGGGRGGALAPLRSSGVCVVSESGNYRADEDKCIPQALGGDVFTRLI